MKTNDDPNELQKLVLSLLQNSARVNKLRPYSGQGKKPLILPARNSDSRLECIEFLIHDLGTILIKHNAPDEWRSQFKFLVTYLLFPKTVDAAT